jgi:hypothetical protein
MVMDVMGTTRFGIAGHLGARCGKRSSCSFSLDSLTGSFEHIKQ